MGSPPHTRGILSYLRHEPQGQGLTPAYAGNTFCHLDGSRKIWAHPRIRGEYWDLSTPARSWVGSPPHTRGIPGHPLLSCWHPGLTPAYAGNTCVSHVVKLPVRAHPRIRGEYLCPSAVLFADMGSPPHTRGIRSFSASSSVSVGLTPAYAGNTQCFQEMRFCGWAHPRIRGEYRIYLCFSVYGRGSPPHTRGIPTYIVDFSTCERLTPAYAGNTTRSCF